MRTLFLLIAMLIPIAQEPDPAAMFDRGMTFETFLSEAKAQHDTWVQNAGRANPSPEMVDRLKRAGADLKFLVIAEPACSDSVNSLPYLAKLASAAGVDLRIVYKAVGQPIMDQHRTPDGRAATPTVVLLRAGKPVAAWIERPSALQEWYLGPGAKLSQQERSARKLAWYDWDRGDSSLEEILRLAEGH
jgi:hypothetical protein